MDFLAYNTAVANITTPTVCPLDTIGFNSEGFALAAGELTALPAGVYEVRFECSVMATASNSRSQVRAWIEVDGVEQAGTSIDMYVRQSGFGASGSATTVVTLAAPGAIRGVAERTVGTSTIEFRTGGSRLCVTVLS